jgi:hypothetical protein
MSATKTLAMKLASMVVHIDEGLSARVLLQTYDWERT